MTDTQYDVEEQTSIANDPATRRSFLKNSALSALAVGALAACKGNTAAAASTVKQNGTGATADASGGSMAAHPAPVSAASAAEEMDRMHEAGIKAFPAKTGGKGNEVLAPRLDGDVKVYHSHHNAAKQVGLGLLGAFIVEPRRPKAIERCDVDYTMILNDGSHGYTVNGKGFPATEPIVAKLGQKVRIRFMNEGMMIHPMHLHGMHMTVIAKDGWDQPAPWKCDTLNIAPGERWDVIVNCNNPGTWAFHCHILPHAESEHGMFGMVTALIVEK